MKPQETKERFVLLRAEGKSFSVIAKELEISKSTCTAWERELKERIAEYKADSLNQLYDAYHMTREARIKQLGETLEGINDALSSVDLSKVPPERLLDFKLKYSEALKEEYISTEPAQRLPDDLRPADLLLAFTDLLNRHRAGDITEEQANRESTIIANLLKAYDALESQKKIEALEAILGRRS